jgi:hypothetical protein
LIGFIHAGEMDSVPIDNANWFTIRYRNEFQLDHILVRVVRVPVMVI